MNAPQKNAKKVTGTRSHIIQLLRKRKCTVEDLANEIGVTENAIRAQVTLLQRDGLVEPVGRIKGTRKPSLVYGPTAGVDLHFSKAYPSVLAHLLGVLAEEMSHGRFRILMNKLGQKIAGSESPPKGSLRDRVKGAVKFYDALGALAEIEEEDGKLIIKGHGCPLAEAITADAGICIAVESLMSELIGRPVHQRCDRSDRPSCRFEVEISTKAKVT